MGSRKTMMENKPPFKTNRDDWQLPGKTGTQTKRKAKRMRKPPFDMSDPTDNCYIIRSYPSGRRGSRRIRYWVGADHWADNMLDATPFVKMGSKIALEMARTYCVGESHQPKILVVGPETKD